MRYTTGGLIKRGLIGLAMTGWAVATLWLAVQVSEQATIMHVYPLCAYDHAPQEIRGELDTAFETAWVLAGWSERTPTHEGLYVTPGAWWGYKDSQYGKLIESMTRDVWGKVPTADRPRQGRPVSACREVKMYALKDGDRDWVQTYPWARLRDTSEIPGYDGTTGVTFKNLKFPGE